MTDSTASPSTRHGVALLDDGSFPPKRSQLTLVSHRLCPYVQRAAIVLAEKGMACERIDIDLAHKPDWFLKVSPLGKTPVLLVNGQPIFESAAICEYLDEIALPRLHPENALQRARHRGWMEFGSALLNAIGAFYNAGSEAALAVQVTAIRGKFEQIEAELGAGPYFSGERFTVVDAVFGPVFRYFDVFEQFADFGFFTHTPRVRAWRAALAARDSVKGAASTDYPRLLKDFLLARQSALAQRISAAVAA
jgi:glutathione S-transferase